MTAPLARFQRRHIAIIGLVAIILVGLVAFIHGVVHAAGNTYYVATNGSDSNTGQALSAPFLTVQKCANVAQAGDTCLIRAGTYHETVTPANSGSSGSPIIFQPYNGESVTVDGADAVTGWSQYSGNIYQASVTLPVSEFSDTGFFANQVFVDGHMMNEARWPNTSLDQLHPTEATAGSGTTCNSIHDSNLPNINWTGATVYIHGGYGWNAETGTVTASSSGVINFSGADTDCGDLGAKSGSFYYLTGLFSQLDGPNEWFYDNAAHKLYLWTNGSDSPANHTIETKQRTNAFSLSNRSYITIAGLNIFSATITTDANSSNDVINGITATYVSHFVTIPTNPNEPSAGAYCAHSADNGIILNGSNDTIENSVVAYSAGNGIIALGSGHTIINNLVHDVDYAAIYDMGIVAGGNCSDANGSGITVRGNTVYNAGHTAIWFNHNNNIIDHNNVYHFMGLSSDAGGLASSDANAADPTNAITTVAYNWAHDMTDVSGQFSGATAGSGMYFDNGANHYTIHHNVAWNNTNGGGMRINGDSGSSHNLLVYNNTFGSGQAQSIASCCVTDSSGSSVINNVFRGADQYRDDGHNLTSATNPNFVNTTTSDLHVQSTSPAIDAGQIISGITDGYVGSAPDEGAYEYGGTNWTPGCTLTACVQPLTIDDHGASQITYSGSGWVNCASCNGSYSYYAGSISYDSTTNDTATIAFNGVGIRLYTAMWTPSGIAGVKIDSGAETLVDMYSPQESGNALLWNSPVLAAGAHTLTLRVTGTHDAASTGTVITLDRVEVIPASTKVDDSVQGTGANQFNFHGGWNHCTSSCTSDYTNSISYDGTTNDTLTIQFVGTQLAVYCPRWDQGGVAAIAIDGDPSTNIDLHSQPTVYQQLVWLSPELAEGSHTLTITVTGTNTFSGSQNWVPVDSMVAIS